MDDLTDRIRAILDTILEEYARAPVARPWVIGFSGGKDSTLVALLVLMALLELPPSKRRRKVYVVSNDTLVENPVVQSFVRGVLAKTTRCRSSSSRWRSSPRHPRYLKPSGRTSSGGATRPRGAPSGGARTA